MDDDSTRMVPIQNCSAVASGTLTSVDGGWINSSSWGLMIDLLALEMRLGGETASKGLGEAQPRGAASGTSMEMSSEVSPGVDLGCGAVSCWGAASCTGGDGAGLDEVVRCSAGLFIQCSSTCLRMVRGRRNS